MNTQYLKYAIEVARTGSITQAADNLYIGQPSLSKAIKELEDSLGITIFKRTSKGAMPTEKGAEFLKYARAAMMQVEKMEILYRPRNPDRQELSLSIPRSSYIAQAAAEYVGQMSADQEITVNIFETSSVQVIHDVAQGSSSIGVIRYKLRDEGYFMDYLEVNGLKSERLWEYDLLATFSKKHPLSEKSQLSADMLFPHVEVTLSDETIPYITAREENRADAREDKRIAVMTRLNVLEILSEMQNAYFWGAPVPEQTLERYGLVQKSCYQEESKCRDALVYRKKHEFSAVEKHLINKLFESRNLMTFRDGQ